MQLHCSLGSIFSFSLFLSLHSLSFTLSHDNICPKFAIRLHYPTEYSISSRKNASTLNMLKEQCRILEFQGCIIREVELENQNQLAMHIPRCTFHVLSCQAYLKFFMLFELFNISIHFGSFCLNCSASSPIYVTESSRRGWIFVFECLNLSSVHVASLLGN